MQAGISSGRRRPGAARRHRGGGHEDDSSSRPGRRSARASPAAARSPTARNPRSRTRVEQAQRPAQPHLGVVADRGAVPGGGDRDPVGGPQQRLNRGQRDLAVRDVPGDLIGQRQAPAQDRHHEAEPGADPDRARVQLLARQDAGVPLGRVAEPGQVAERLGGAAIPRRRGTWPSVALDRTTSPAPTWSVSRVTSATGRSAARWCTSQWSSRRQAAAISAGRPCRSPGGVVATATPRGRPPGWRA